VGLVSWVVAGAIVGFLAKELVPGPDPGRFIITIILGVAGASLGGLGFGVLSGSGATSFDAWSVLAATFGAVFLLCLYGVFARRTA
jgi:uncharacterized membrane protein YeaQ/YmgE (transglycosylase-associated protein family)